jgi:dihydroorotate dehydrogenase (NAD+) catalytic subunit
LSVPSQAEPLATRVARIAFQNPVFLAAGTAAYGRELAGVMALDDLGGIVTKAVSVEPRAGAPAPRVADFDGGMINAVGLANPGVEEVRAEQLPWLARELKRAKVMVNVVGRVVEDFSEVVARLDDASGFQCYELNVSCPNTRAGGLEFGADEAALKEVVSRCRAATRRPLFVKLSPTLADVGATARSAVDAGADGITVINTMPGLVIDPATRRPVLGFGTGGVSGPGLRPVGVLATWKVHQAVRVPIMGVGGITTAADALQYVIAGASLVAMGTAALADPRAPGRLVRDLAMWCGANRVAHLSDLVGTLQMPA